MFEPQQHAPPQLHIVSDLPDRLSNAEVRIGGFQPGQLLLELRCLRLQHATSNQ